MSMSTAAFSSEYIKDAPSDHVHLILVHHPPFFLQIPITIISSLCLKPRKYLAYLGWCVLGAEGSLTQGDSTTPLDLDGDLDDRGLYYYVTPAGTGLGQAVDLEAIKKWSSVPSQSTETRECFGNNLLERDVRCVFTALSPLDGNGMHIIPYSRGSEWLRLIIQNRPKYEEEVSDMTDIDDIRNGVFVVSYVHTVFDLRRGVILKTPNHFLVTTDIPRGNRILEPPEEAAYPDDVRYTLQWLIEPDQGIGRVSPNNIDAAFKRDTLKPKPSGLLLHYNYGAAAVKWWGHGKEVLQNRPNIPRPTVPAPAPMGPARTVHDRAITIQKRDAARRAREGGAAGSVAAGDQPREIMDSKDDHVQWDEDDVMLFFWGNSPAAVERRRKEEQECSEYMEQWRQGASETSI